ncbi:MAG: Spy/CpxP family protein refolding chaperone [Acidobacteriota bacterium]
MKKVVYGILALIVLAAGAVFVIGQITSRNGHDGLFGGRGGGRMIGMALRGLDLTGDQKAKVKEITTAARTNVGPLMQQMRDNRKNFAALGTDGNFDEAKVEALANEQSGIMSKMIVEREKAKAQIFALLTDAQKAKAAEMRQKFEDRMKDQRHGGKNAKPESEL